MGRYRGTGLTEWIQITPKRAGQEVQEWIEGIQETGRGSGIRIRTVAIADEHDANLDNTPIDGHLREKTTLTLNRNIITDGRLRQTLWTEIRDAHRGYTRIDENSILNTKTQRSNSTEQHKQTPTPPHEPEEVQLEQGDNIRRTNGIMLDKYCYGASR